MEDLPINLKIEREHDGLRNPVSMDEPRYPVLHYSGPADLDLPQDGVMTVKFHVARETSEVDRKTGKHHYDCDIEILSIEKIKGEEVQAPASSGNEAEDALDKIREEMEADEQHEQKAAY